MAGGWRRHRLTPCFWCVALFVAVQQQKYNIRQPAAAPRQHLLLRIHEAAYRSVSHSQRAGSWYLVVVVRYANPSCLASVCVAACLRSNRQQRAAVGSSRQQWFSSTPSSSGIQVRSATHTAAVVAGGQWTDTSPPPALLLVCTCLCGCAFVLHGLRQAQASFLLLPALSLGRQRHCLRLHPAASRFVCYPHGSGSW